MTMKSGTNSYHGSAYDYFPMKRSTLRSPMEHQVARAQKQFWFTFASGLDPRGLRRPRQDVLFFNFEEYRETTLYNQLHIQCLPPLSQRRFPPGFDPKKLATDLSAAT